MIRIQLTDEERQELRREARRTVGRVSERIHFVLLSDQGYSPPRIEAIFGYCAATVRMWLKRYQEQGLAGLQDEPRSGRSPLTSPEEDQCITATVKQSPTTYGYKVAFWTIAMLLSHLGQGLGVQLSSTTLRRRLHQARFRWRRPRLAPAQKEDPEKEAKLARIEQVKAEAKPEDHLLYEDETTVRLLPLLRAMWMLVGQQFRIPVPPSWNRRFHIFGTLDVCTGEWVYRFFAQRTRKEFITFLEHLLTVYPTGRIFIILDNGSIHQATEVLEWLAAHPRIQLVWLPTYSSHLNPVERIWKVMKKAVAANRAYAQLGMLEQAAREFFADLTPAQVLQTASLA
jgi:transposase